MIGIILLALILLIFGYGLCSFFKVKMEGNILENIFIAIGIGLGMFIILSVILSLLHIPLSKAIYIVIALPLGLLAIIRYPVRKIKLTKGLIYSILVLLLFIIHAGVYSWGSYKYNWLEDGDPWHHAVITKYIAEEKTMFEPVGMDTMKYADPYPSSYGALMAFVYQVEGNMIYTLKVFNAILASFSILFAYVAFKKLFKNEDRALLTTVILFLVPSYLSHFIWALTLAMAMFFPVLYALEKIAEDRKWIYIAGVMVAALSITQPSMTIKLGIMLILYIMAKMIVHKNLQKHLLLAGLLGITISSLWWGTALVRWGSPFDEEGWYGIYTPKLGKHIEENPGWFKIKGTADREYSYSDIVIAKIPNAINNPIGLGSVLFYVMCIGILFLLFDYKKLFKEEWRLVALFWIVFAFIGIHGARLPIQFYAFRFWMLFALASSFLVGGTLLDGLSKLKTNKYIVIGLILLGIAITSGYPKYQINTSIWPPGGIWTNSGELADYFYLDQIVEPGTRIYPLCMYGTDKIISFGLDTCAWCKDEWEFRESFLNKTNDEVYDFLTIRDYSYLTLDGVCMGYYPIEEVNTWFGNLLNDSRFQVINEPRGMVLIGIQSKSLNST